MPGPQPRHFNDLPDAGTIETELLLRTHRCVSDCVRHRTLGVIVGDAGFGKTFAVDDALSRSNERVIRTLFSYNTTPREVARQLLQEATGVAATGTKFDLADGCVDVFREPHVAMIDEAQHLNRNCTFFLRFLLDHPDTKVALILVGGNGCWSTITRDPMLRSRVYRRVVFKPMSLRVLQDALPHYHPIYSGVSSEFVAELYERCGIGQFRTLAIFTLTALELCRETGLEKVDGTVVERALKLIADGVDV